MNQFYIARHGETENNRARRLSGWADTPLTENGLEPTKSVIEKLRDISIDDMYSSDLGRAIKTAEGIAKGLGFTKQIIQLFGLREVSYGKAANMQCDEAYKLYPGLDSDTHFIPPGGESLEHMQSRVFATINELNDKHDDSNILLVCHSGVMAAIRSSHIGQDFGAHNISEAYPHDYVAKFSIEDNIIRSFEELK